MASSQNLTKRVKLTESAIKSALKDKKITRLSFEGEPHLFMKIHSNRQQATWHMSTPRGTKRSQRFAGYPEVSVKMFLKNRDEILMKYKLSDSGAEDHWLTVGELLDWFLGRTVTDQSLDSKTRICSKSIINTHLMPALKGLEISRVTQSTLNDLLFWELQKKYALSTVRQIFAKLKRAFTIAEKQCRITKNPMSTIHFSHLNSGRIKPKPAGLLERDLSGVIEQVFSQANIYNRLPAAMLLFGMRISETRQLRWEYLDFTNKTMLLPAKITKGRSGDLELPLTDFAINFFKQHKQIQRDECGRPCPYVFSYGLHPMSHTQANDAVKAVSNGNWVSHDLRKLARSMWTRLGTDYWIAERILNHALRGLDEAYIDPKMSRAKKIEALELWHNHLDENIKKILPVHYS